MSESFKQGEAVPAHRFGPFGAAAVAAYASASGDDNPLHSDPSVAQRAKLPGMPIHGMLIMGSFEAYLERWRPGLRVRKISQKFIRPVFVGAGFEISGKVVQAQGPIVLRLTVKDDQGALVGLGEAFVDP